jgi:hypothetical protein
MHDYIEVLSWKLEPLIRLSTNDYVVRPRSFAALVSPGSDLEQWRSQQQIYGVASAWHKLKRKTQIKSTIEIIDATSYMMH